MNEPSPQQRVQTLREELRRHNYQYHVKKEPLITDAEYDQLLRELIELEQAYPELRSDDSPTQRVGSDLEADFAKVEHPAPILSLANAFNANELEEWEARNQRRLGREVDFDYVLELKLDGLSIVLTYENGSLVTAATRGNGEVGDDVTPNVRTINTIPLTIPANPESDYDAPERLVVRGEVLFLLEDFEALNQAQTEKGETTFVNPRNAAAGSLKQKDSRITAERPLTAYLYDVVTSSDDVTFSSEWETLAYLRELGFNIIPHAEKYPTLSHIIQQIPTWQERRDELPFEIDGLVVKIDDVSVREELGFVGKDPRGSVAYKFPAEEATTQLIGVTVNIGRTGKVTPTAQLEPVYIGGVTVSNASLHNYELIQELDIRMHDRVTVKRSGDVIPYVVGPVTGAREGSEEPISPPEQCPFCETKLIKPAGAVDLYCPNRTCPERVFRSLEFFVSRGAMDIDGMGPQTIKTLIDNDLIQDEADLFYLEAEPLHDLEGFGEKKAANLLASVNAAKERPLAQLLAALGIDGIGSTVSELLTSHFDTMQDFIDFGNVAKTAEREFIAFVEPLTVTQGRLEEQLDDVKKARRELQNPLVELVPRYIDGKNIETRLERRLRPLLEIAPDDAPNLSAIVGKLQAVIDAAKPLLQIDGIGPVMVRNIIDWFADEHNQHLLHKMREAGVNMQAAEDTQVSAALEGLTFVLTGSMSEPRKTISNLIEEHGGKVTGSVSGNTDYVVVGENPGSKADNARQRDIPIISEDQLREMIAS